MQPKERAALSDARGDNSEQKLATVHQRSRLRTRTATPARPQLRRRAVLATIRGFLCARPAVTAPAPVLRLSLRATRSSKARQSQPIWQYGSETQSEDWCW